MKKLYIVYVHITPDGMHYYGVTSNIKKRWCGNGCMYKQTSLYPYIEKFGWENIHHIILFENQSKEDALSIEDSLILSGREKGNCINKQRSGNVSKEDGYDREYRREYYEKNREKILEYYEKNREKILEYYEKNREKILEYHREYNEKNREKYNEYRRKYNEKNREKYREYQREYQRKYRQRKKLKKQLKEVEI